MQGSKIKIIIYLDKLVTTDVATIMFDDGGAHLFLDPLILVISVVQLHKLAVGVSAISHLFCKSKYGEYMKL